MSIETLMMVRRSSLLDEVVSVSERLMTDNDVSPATAAVVANALADHLADYWGGQLINFPKDHRRKLAKIEVEIYGQFDGSNYGALAFRYNMSERGVRKLITRVRARLAKQTEAAQMQLPV